MITIKRGWIDLSSPVYFDIPYKRNPGGFEETARKKHK